MKIVKFFKNNTTLSNSWILLIGNGTITLLNFVFISILSHNLPQNIYGNFREIFLLLNLLITAGAAGFAQTLFYFLNQTRNSNQKLYIIAQIRYLLIVLQLILLLVAAAVFLIQPSSLSGFTLVDFVSIGIYVAFTSITIVDINLAIVFKKSKALIFSNILWLSLKIIFLFYYKNLGITLSIIVMLMALTQILICINNQFIIGKNYWGKITELKVFNAEIILKLLKYNVPLGLSTLIGFLILNTDRFILYLNSGNPNKFATLSNVAFEVPLIGNIYGAFFTMALPVMIKSYQKNDITSFLKARFDYTKNVAVLVFPIVIGFMVWHSEFVNFIFGENYNKLSYLFFFYSFISLLRFCSHHDILLATHNTKYIFYLYIAELFFHILLSWFFYTSFDLKGLIFASILTNYIYMIVVNMLSARLIGVSIKNIFPYVFLLKQLIICFAVAAAIKYLLQPIIGYNLWFVAIIIYGIIILSTHYKNINKLINNS